MVTKLFVPSLEAPPLAVQLVVVRSGLFCKVQPAEGYAQEIVRVSPVMLILNLGLGDAATKP